MLAARDVVRNSGLGSLLILAACTATATEVPPEAAKELNSLKSSLATGKAQIQRATEAARGVDKAASATMAGTRAPRSPVSLPAWLRTGPAPSSGAATVPPPGPRRWP